jgi:hypothetical protein
MPEPYRPRYVVMRIASPPTVEADSDGLTYVLSEALWVPEAVMAHEKVWDYIRPQLEAIMGEGDRWARIYPDEPPP